MLHPIRWKIINALKRENRPMYIDEIAKLIGEDRRLVSFHLSTLEEHKFLNSEFKLLKKPQSKGKAGRFYELTDKVDHVLKDFIRIIQG